MFELIGPDTALTPDCGKTSASRQTLVTGKAAQLAGQALRAPILRMTNWAPAARIALGDRRRIAVTDGTARRRDRAGRPARGRARLCADRPRKPTTRRPRPLDENGQGVPYAVYGYGAQMAEVEVDMALGTVQGAPHHRRA